MKWPLPDRPEPGHDPGHHRLEGSRHGARMLAAGPRVVGGTNPRKRSDHRSERHRRAGVGTVADTMAATAPMSRWCLCGPPDQGRGHRGDRCRDPAVHRDHRGHPRPRQRGVWAYAAPRGTGTRIIGPNCPGVASPGKSNAASSGRHHHRGPDRPGLHSGTPDLPDDVRLRDIGFSTAVGIGGDPVIGTTHIDCLQAFQEDPETEAIVIIGEIGGDAEERPGPTSSST